MASQRPFAYHHQNLHWYSNVCKGEDHSTLPSAEPENPLTRTSVAPLFPQSAAPNLFSSLLFNREIVYGDNSTSLYSPPRWHATVESSTIARRRPTEALRTSGKDGQQRSSLGHTHEGVEQGSERSSMPGMLAYLKADQVRPVSGGRGNLGTRMTTKTKAKNQEDRSQKRSASRTIPRASKLQKISLHLSDDDDDNEDMQSETEWRSTRKNDEPAAPDSTASKAPKPDMMACLESEIELKINPYRTKLQGQTIRVSTEKLCQELEAVKAEIESVRRLNAQLERELNDEREASHAVAEERDQLRVEVDLSRSQQKELSTKYKDLQHRHEQVQTDHETILEDIIKAQDSEDNKHTQEVKEQMKTMKDENARLARENEILKAAATPSSLHRSTTSPAPSSVSSDKEQKTENIRRTYVKVKRRYDHLHKAANDLSMCTRSTDLSCFGEVGQCLKHLRTALEEDSHERQALLVHEQNQVGK